MNTITLKIRRTLRPLSDFALIALTLTLVAGQFILVATTFLGLELVK